MKIWDTLTISIEPVNAQDKSHIWRYISKTSDLLGTRIQASHQVESRLCVSPSVIQLVLILSKAHRRIYQRDQGVQELHPLLLKKTDSSQGQDVGKRLILNSSTPSSSSCRFDFRGKLEANCDLEGTWEDCSHGLSLGEPKSLISLEGRRDLPFGSCHNVFSFSAKSRQSKNSLRVSSVCNF